MSGSIYLTLANILIKIDAKRTAQKQRKLYALDSAQLTPYILKDIGLESLVNQRKIEHYQHVSLTNRTGFDISSQRFRVNI